TKPITALRHTGIRGFSAATSAPCGARISSTMIVMMTAITPSLKASIRDFVNQRLVARLAGTCRQLRPRQVEDGLLRHVGVHRAAQPADRVQRGRVDAQAVQERL